MSGVNILSPIEEQLLDAVSRALDGAPADDARALYIADVESVSRFALNRLHQGVERHTSSLTIEVAVGKKLGRVNADGATIAQIPALIAQAADIARTAPETREFTGFYRPPQSAPFDDCPPATAGYDAMARATQLAPAFQAAAKQGFTFAGSAGSRLATIAVLSRGGGRRIGRRASADARLFAVDGTVSGFAGRTAGDAGTLGVEQLAELALSRAARGRKPVSLSPGKYPVVLMPHAVAELIEWFSSIAANASAVEDGMSVIAARAGQAITGKSFTLRDDSHDPAGLPFPFDFEGRDRSAVTFVDAGVAGKTVNDTLAAARLKQEPTGHAFMPGGEGGGTPLHVFMSPGAASEEQLIASIERGIYVTKFHYVNGFLDPPQAVMTGLTRDGAFLIENGKLGRGIENLRFTQSLLEAGRNIRAVSSFRETVPAWWSSLGSFTVPALCIDDFTFTGSASDTAI